MKQTRKYAAFKNSDVANIRPDRGFHGSPRNSFSFDFHSKGVSLQLPFHVELPPLENDFLDKFESAINDLFRVEVVVPQVPHFDFNYIFSIMLNNLVKFSLGKYYGQEEGSLDAADRLRGDLQTRVTLVLINLKERGCLKDPFTALIPGRDLDSKTEKRPSSEAPPIRMGPHSGDAFAPSEWPLLKASPPASSAPTGTLPYNPNPYNPYSPVAATQNSSLVRRPGVASFAALVPADFTSAATAAADSDATNPYTQVVSPKVLQRCTLNAAPVSSLPEFSGRPSPCTSIASAAPASAAPSRKHSVPLKVLGPASQNPASNSAPAVSPVRPLGAASFAAFAPAAGSSAVPDSSSQGFGSLPAEKHHQLEDHRGVLLPQGLISRVSPSGAVGSHAFFSSASLFSRSSPGSFAPSGASHSQLSNEVKMLQQLAHDQEKIIAEQTKDLDQSKRVIYNLQIQLARKNLFIDQYRQLIEQQNGQLLSLTGGGLPGSARQSVGLLGVGQPSGIAELFPRTDLFGSAPS